jgi:predicted metal-binding protein
VKRHVSSHWAEVVLVCRKCSKKLGGGFGPQGDKPLAKALKKRAGGKGRKAAFGVIETGCLDICPKRGVTVVRGSTPGDWQVIEAGTPVDAVAARLGLG